MSSQAAEDAISGKASSNSQLTPRSPLMSNFLFFHQALDHTMILEELKANLQSWDVKLSQVRRRDRFCINSTGSSFRKSS